MALLEVRGLTKHFPIGGGWRTAPRWVHAVDGLDLDIAAGETLGIVGESGCGKSTLARLLLRLIEPTSGSIRFEGEDLLALDRHALRRRRRDIQMIFQDPYASLNPRLRVGDIVGEGIEIHRLASGAAKRKLVLELLERVGLRPDAYDLYPHQFSGGQRQRIGIARALAVRPKLIVADEPVSALDVSIQAQIVNLLHDLQQEYGLAFIFIAHDLRVVEHISNRIAVMYLGKVVELAEAERLAADPHHPYTRALLSAVPMPDPAARRTRIVLPGEPPNPIDPPAGCRFHPRCPDAVRDCSLQEPALLGTTAHAVACPLHPIP